MQGFTQLVSSQQEGRKLEHSAASIQEAQGTKGSLQPKTGIPPSGELLMLFMGDRKGGPNCPSLPHNLENF